jgi:hypothetical protein
MKRVGFVACSKTKLHHAAPAGALYSSALFRKSLLAALDSTDEVYVLSALHGIVGLRDPVEPYDLTLKSMESAARARWVEKVSQQLVTILRPGDVATFYTGEEYSRPLLRTLSHLGGKSYEPLAGLSMGSRLASLRLLNAETQTEAIEQALRPHIRRLKRAQAGGRRFQECRGTSGWPQRGIYIILESDEGAAPGRVVRVGTHAVSAGSSTTLWQRLISHKGTTQGVGSHRSSIFRSHVGRAILRRGPNQAVPISWGVGQTAPAAVRETEIALERDVSAYIAQLRVLWLDVSDAAGPNSDRAYLERNLIGTYSRLGLVRPRCRTGWLGEWSPDWRIAASGLWNLDHLFVRPDCRFVDVVAYYVSVTIEGRPAPSAPLAPDGWRLRRTPSATQMALFESGKIKSGKINGGRE